MKNLLETLGAISATATWERWAETYDGRPHGVSVTLEARASDGSEVKVTAATLEEAVALATGAFKVFRSGKGLH